MKRLMILVFASVMITSCKPSEEEQVKKLTDNIVQSLKENDSNKFESCFASFEEIQKWVLSNTDKAKANRNLNQLNKEVSEGKYSKSYYKDMFYRLRQDPIMLYRDTAFWSKSKISGLTMEKISLTSNNASRTRFVVKFKYSNDEIKLLIEPYKEKINDRWYIVDSPKWVDYEEKMMNRILNQ